ncbi:hypothetical protein AB0H17_28215, partial [Streptomyces olivoreticuli]
MNYLESRKKKGDCKKLSLHQFRYLTAIEAPCVSQAGVLRDSYAAACESSYSAWTSAGFGSRVMSEV